MIKRLLLATALLAPLAAYGQSVQQSGTVTTRHIPYWAGNGVISDAGTSADSPISSIGVTNEGGAGFCVGSLRQSAAGRNLLCFSAATAASAKISLQNYGTAAAQNLDFVINGTTVTLPTGGGTFVLANGPFTVGHASCWLNTAGVLVDCGAGLAVGTQFGMAYYSASDVIGATAAGTNGQIPVATTSAAPAFKTLSGDVGSVSSAGAVTLAKVNGIPFASTYTAHGTLVAQGTGQWTASVTNNVGYCWLSQGLSADPIWAPCASGSGAAGGADTQVQYNAATTLAGSANLTWVSPTLTIGVAGSTTGKLGLASSTATGTVTLQATGVSTPYNFNFPTGAGTTGQPLISGGGGSSPNTYGTLGIFGGGTNCAAASGTCLDNITGFSSTGYIKRTGSGTYALSSPIPVSDGGTNLASGTSGGILGFTASGTLASSALLTANGLLIGGGAGATPTALAACTDGQIPVGVSSAAPVCRTLSGDITTVSSAGAMTIANSSITVAKQANAAAYSLEGNFTNASAAPQFSTIGGLTAKASPAGTDLILIQDQAAAGQLKQATVSSVASAGSVASVNALTGAITVAGGTGISVTTSAPTITVALTAARQTLPTTQIFTTGSSATYTTPANTLYIDVTLVGSGGGGGGSGTGGGTGGAGGDTCWKTSGTACSTPDFAGLAGAGGATGSAGAAGGATTGTCNLGSITGATGGGVTGAIATVAGGPFGGGSYGPGGGGGAIGGAGAAGQRGGGGGGAGVNGVGFGGAGAGGGGTCRFRITSPAASYVYTCGAAAAGGTAGTSGFAGGAGGSCYIIVDEHYGT